MIIRKQEWSIEFADLAYTGKDGVCNYRNRRIVSRQSRPAARSWSLFVLSMSHKHPLGFLKDASLQFSIIAEITDPRFQGLDSRIEIFLH